MWKKKIKAISKEKPVKDSMEILVKYSCCISSSHDYIGITFDNKEDAEKLRDDVVRLLEHAMRNNNFAKIKVNDEIRYVNPRQVFCVSAYRISI